MAGYEDVANRNIFRYRGYIYDTETQLYYLQSRYYDPAICRFLNADSWLATGQGLIGNNMYAYCLNNPVNYSDPTGEIVFTASAILIIAVGALALLTITAIAASDPNVQSATNQAYASMVDTATAVKGWITSIPVFQEKTPVTTAPDNTTKNPTSGITIGNPGPATKPLTKTKDKVGTLTEKKRDEFSYWTADLVGSGPHSYVQIGGGLTAVQAAFRVSQGLSIMCKNQAAAWNIVFMNGYINAVGPEAHGYDGYYYHYHPHRHSHVHIWFKNFT